MSDARERINAFIYTVCAHETTTMREIDYRVEELAKIVRDLTPTPAEHPTTPPVDTRLAGAREDHRKALECLKAIAIDPYDTETGCNKSLLHEIKGQLAYLAELEAKDKEGNKR